MFSFKIYDELSGIESYRGEINNKWVLMEYDFKTNIIKYQFDTISNCGLFDDYGSFSFQINIKPEDSNYE